MKEKIDIQTDTDTAQGNIDNIYQILNNLDRTLVLSWFFILPKSFEKEVFN